MSEGASTANARRLPLMEAFQTVKDKLACNEHPGENQWCWIDNPTTRGGDAVHIPLCLHDIQMWAQYLVGVLSTFRRQFSYALIVDPLRRHCVHITSKYWTFQ